MYGFPVTTCCGSSPQNNTWKASWADFYANNRLRAVVGIGIKNNGADAELSRAVETTADVIVPRLLGDDHLKGVQPVIIHGDLWSGNHGHGRIAGKGGVEEVVFDPSCVYGHSEYELGIMKMFGGFGSNFWKEYQSLVPKAEPKEEWDDRIALYELLPTKDGLLDWDCAEAIDFGAMARALEHIHAEGTFPPFVDSKEDQNTVGKCTVSESAISAAKARVEAWLAPVHPRVPQPTGTAAMPCPCQSRRSLRLLCAKLLYLCEAIVVVVPLKSRVARLVLNPDWDGFTTEISKLSSGQLKD
ncbi:hypothetical protein NUW58_g10046 [Xylaria curta]|uniref:Uncharacterized protein n=1 Tax=Xylaria curta TaxID=42375 RepID=A0ACC1MQA2_9PEZI|nr:hypothetical protein NUW58_g10046 [Xylaria curta]